IRDFHVTGVQTCALPISPRRTSTASTPTPATRWRGPTTSSATATRSAAGRSVSTARTCRSGSSRSWASARRKRRRSSASCSRRSSTAPRPTAVSRSAGTGSAPCSPAPTRSARSSRSRSPVVATPRSPLRRRRSPPSSAGRPASTPSPSRRARRPSSRTAPDRPTYDGAMSDGLFEVPGHAPRTPAGSLAGNTHASAPLAVRMRPRTLDELVGQQHLLAPGSPLRRLIEGDQPMSLLLWGPPGVGKTTIASIVSQQTDRHFAEVSAVAAGVKEVRAAIDAARSELVRTGRETVLFVDEVHRFSKAQQDALLPGVENRWVSLVAATTENPFFSVISPLLSRSLLLTLEPLTDDDIRQVVRDAVADERGLAGSVRVDDAALDQLVRLAGGDARRSLTYLEAAAGAATSDGAGDDGVAVVDLATVERAVDRAAVRYD